MTKDKKKNNILVKNNPHKMENKNEIRLQTLNEVRQHRQDEFSEMYREIAIENDVNNLITI